MSKTQTVQKFIEVFNNDKIAAIKAIQNYQVIGSSGYDAPFLVKSGNIAITLRDVSKTYRLHGHEVNVLKDISLDVYEGEFVAITGVSGSGKSTLLQLMGGLDRQTTGLIKIGEHDISKLSDKQLSQLRNTTIGFVFQFFYLQPFLKLDRNIEVPGMFRRMKRAERQVRTNELLKVVGLDKQREHYPKQLSGGQLQRAAISRALLNRPKIILADEPTGNLDSENSRAIIEIFANMRKLYNVTIVLVTHDDAIARKADRILTMKDGEIS